MFDVYFKSIVSSQIWQFCTWWKCVSNIFIRVCSLSKLQPCLRKNLIDTICLIEFPDPYQGNSIWNKVERLTNNPHRELLQELNECLHCPMQTTAAKSKHYWIFQISLFLNELVLIAI